MHVLASRARVSINAVMPLTSALRLVNSSNSLACSGHLQNQADAMRNSQKATRAMRILLATIMLVGSSAAFAGSITDEQATAILEELRQIRQLLERQQVQSLNRTNTI